MSGQAPFFGSMFPKYTVVQVSITKYAIAEFTYALGVGEECTPIYHLRPSDSDGKIRKYSSGSEAADVIVHLNTVATLYERKR